MKKIKVSEGYKKDDGTFVHTVTIGEERFENVENIKKYQKCDSSNCKYFRECQWNDGVVRKFDCQKNRARAIGVYNFITGTMITCFFCYLFLERHVSFFKGAGIMLLAIVGLDVICTIIETAVPNIRDNHFHKMLQKRDGKLKARTKKQKAAEEARKANEEFEKMSGSMYYQDIVNAENAVNTLKKLSDECDFGDNDEKIDQCVRKLIEIIGVLKEDDSGYGRVAYLFEVYIEEFYNTLKMYTNFIKADIHNSRNEQLLTECVDSFLKYLNNQKVQAIFDKSSVEIQFRTAAETLKKMVDSKGEE